MGIIWVKCPSTGRKGSTGISSESEAVREFPDQLRRVRCVFCGSRHNWTASDAWVQRSAQPELLRRAS